MEVRFSPVPENFCFFFCLSWVWAQFRIISEVLMEENAAPAAPEKLFTKSYLVL